MDISMDIHIHGKLVLGRKNREHYCVAIFIGRIMGLVRPVYPYRTGS